ncbi:MAG: peptidase M3, partial [Burkholderiales bacterium]|nr:peptidase M3 [Burkholderiales bacterium]
MSELNPLLEQWSAAFGLPPFERIHPEHFEPALRAAMASHREELQRIAKDARAPDFENTLAAFDRSGRLLGRIVAVYENLAASATSPELQAVQRRMAAPLAAHRNAVYLDAALFARIEVLHRRREQLGLAPEALRLLERVHLDFVRA